MQNPSWGSTKALWQRAVRKREGLAAGRLRRGSPGQGMVEYALVLMLIALVVIVILQVLGGHVSDMYSNVSNGITTAGG